MADGKMDPLLHWARNKNRYLVKCQDMDLLLSTWEKAVQIDLCTLTLIKIVV